MLSSPIFPCTILSVTIFRKCGGDMQIGYTSVHSCVDCTPLYVDLTGHVLVYEESTKALEFNLSEELETLMTAIYKKMRERGQAREG